GGVSASPSHLVVVADRMGVLAPALQLPAPLKPRLALCDLELDAPEDDRVRHPLVDLKLDGANRAGEVLGEPALVAPVAHGAPLRSAAHSAGASARRSVIGPTLRFRDRAASARHRHPRRPRACARVELLHSESWPTKPRLVANHGILESSRSCWDLARFHAKIPSGELLRAREPRFRRFRNLGRGGTPKGHASRPVACEIGRRHGASPPPALTHLPAHARSAERRSARPGATR